MRMTANLTVLCCAALVFGCSGSPDPASQGVATAVQPQPDTSVRVFVGNGHTQCANDALTLAQTQMILVQGGIDVLGSACGAITGIFYPTVCGAATSDINIHRVRRENLGDAERLGFRNVADIGTVPGMPGTGFLEVNCDTREPVP